MGHMPATDIVLIITTLSTAIVAIISAVKARASDKVGRENGTKLDNLGGKTDIIHGLTNGTLQALRERLDEERRRNMQLNAMLVEIINLLPEGSASKLVDSMKKSADEVMVHNQVSLTRK